MTAHSIPATQIINIKAEFEKAIRTRLPVNATYSLVSRLDVEAALEFQLNAESFLQNSMHDFLEQCSRILPLLTHQDVMSIGGDAPSTTATAFLELFTTLEHHGIHGPDYFKMPVNFWSGESAGNKAYEAPNELSDYETPSMSFMHMMIKCIQQARGRYDDEILLLSMAVSRVFSTHAHGIANVYVASEKANECAGLTVCNNFWEGELSNLLARHRAGHVHDIQFHFYDDAAKQWQTPVSFFAPASHFIRVRRRNAHRHDNADQVRLFKTQSMSGAERLQWKAAPPRPAVTLGRIRQIVSIWREKAAKTTSNVDTNKLSL